MISTNQLITFHPISLTSQLEIASTILLINFLPHSLNLITGDEFNQPIDELPLTLTHLTTGEYFNQSVDKLPPKLTHLTVEYNFDRTVDRLPLTLALKLETFSTNLLTNRKTLYHHINQ
jgi:FNIP Repeat